MARTSISVPEEVIEKFDDVLWDYQTEKVLPREPMRSAVITQLMVDFIENHEQWMDEHEDWIEDQWPEDEEGNPTRQATISSVRQ